VSLPLPSISFHFPWFFVALVTENNHVPKITDMQLLPGDKRRCPSGKSEKQSEISTFSGWIAQYTLYKYNIQTLNIANRFVVSEEDLEMSYPRLLSDPSWPFSLACSKPSSTV
jgi:hypothetical protein